MTLEIISRSISTKVWDRAGIELATPGIAVRHASVARHVTNCATRPGIYKLFFLLFFYLQVENTYFTDLGNERIYDDLKTFVYWDL